jgi:hypothetical protein
LALIGRVQGIAVLVCGDPATRTVCRGHTATAPAETRVASDVSDERAIALYTTTTQKRDLSGGVEIRHNMAGTQSG